MKKNLAGFITVTLSSFLMTMVSFAGTDLIGREGQWIQDESGWRWQYANDGSYALAWNWLDGNGDGICECYMFDGDGYMMANAASADGFFVNADGAWVKDGVVQTKEVIDLDAAAAETADDGAETTSESADVTANYTDNGGYNQYGVSNVVLEMMKNSREENEKFGEIGTYKTYDYIVIYANGIMVTYPRANADNDQKRIKLSPYRDDLDDSYLFKYYESGLTKEAAKAKLVAAGYTDNSDQIGGVHNGLSDCLATTPEVGVFWNCGTLDGVYIRETYHAD